MLNSSDTPTGFRLAVRARFGWLANGALLAMIIAASLSAQFGGRQPATVALDVGLSVIRLLLPLVMVLMTQELLSREFDRRYFLNTLSYPHPRHKLLLGRFVAIAVLTLGLLLIYAVALALLVWLLGHHYEQSTPVALDHNYLLTISFIGLDLLLLTSLGTLLAVVASTPSFVLIGTFGFMLVARSYGAILELLSRDAGLVSNTGGYRASLGMLSYLLPDLGALDLRMLALYGQQKFLPNDWPWLMLSAVGYSIALLALAVWALQRKRFS